MEIEAAGIYQLMLNLRAFALTVASFFFTYLLLGRLGGYVATALPCGV